MKPSKTPSSRSSPSPRRHPTCLKQKAGRGVCVVANEGPNVSTTAMGADVENLVERSRRHDRPRSAEQYQNERRRKDLRGDIIRIRLKRNGRLVTDRLVLSYGLMTPSNMACATSVRATRLIRAKPGLSTNDLPLPRSSATSSGVWRPAIFPAEVLGGRARAGQYQFLRTGGGGGRQTALSRGRLLGFFQLQLQLQQLKLRTIRRTTSHLQAGQRRTTLFEKKCAQSRKAQVIRPDRLPQTQQLILKFLRREGGRARAVRVPSKRQALVLFNFNTSHRYVPPSTVF